MPYNADLRVLLAVYDDDGDNEERWAQFKGFYQAVRARFPAKTADLESVSQMEQLDCQPTRPDGSLCLPIARPVGASQG